MTGLWANPYLCRNCTGQPVENHTATERPRRVVDRGSFAAMDRGECCAPRCLHGNCIGQHPTTTGHNFNRFTTTTTTAPRCRGGHFFPTCTNPSNNAFPQAAINNTTTCTAARCKTYDFTKGRIGILFLDARAVRLRVQEERGQGTLGTIGVLLWATN